MRALPFHRCRTRTMIERAVEREGQLDLAARLRVDPPALEYWRRTGRVPREVRAALTAPEAPRVRSGSAA